ncbi:MAG: YkgJ family cysteine cluster protein [Desulfamplus sp.]|nr:YkgJ family cysteine cluster protein [Desulfamplus sp.]
MDSISKTEDDIFKCRMCGSCCSGFGGTYVSREECLAISQFIGCDPASFREKYCSVSGSGYVLATSEDGNCIFFDDKKGCTIHPVKPPMCRKWPFIEAVIHHPENWNVMAGSCPGMKKDVPWDVLKKIISVKINNQNIAG